MRDLTEILKFLIENKGSKITDGEQVIWFDGECIVGFAKESTTQYEVSIKAIVGLFTNRDWRKYREPLSFIGAMMKLDEGKHIRSGVTNVTYTKNLNGDIISDRTDDIGINFVEIKGTWYIEE